MAFSFTGNKEKNGRPFLVLDLGTEAVKLLICQTFAEKPAKTFVFGFSLKYFEGSYSSFDSNFNVEKIKKIILESFNESQQMLCFSAASKELKERVARQKKWEVLVTLSPDILKSRISSQIFEREKTKEKITRTEEKIIREKICKEACKEISEKFAKETGILASDIHWVSAKIVGTKIDGYKISSSYNYEGKDLEYKVMATFLPESYFDKIKNIVEENNWKIMDITSGVEALPSLCCENGNDGIFFDIGGEITQISFVKSGAITEIAEFDKGGKGFSKILSKTLGIDEENARILKEEYSQKILSAGGLKKIKDILTREQKIWYEALASKIEETGARMILSSNVFLFGGGAMLSETQECLTGGKAVEFGLLPIFDSPDLKVFSPADLKGIQDTTKNLKSPQYIPVLLAILARQNGQGPA